MSKRMTVKEFDSLKPIDFQNGAVLDEIRCALKELESFLHDEKEQYWPGPNDILEMRGKEQQQKETDKEYCICGKPAGHREDCWPDGKPDEWEEWVDKICLMVELLPGYEETFKRTLLSIPCNPRRKP